MKILPAFLLNLMLALFGASALASAATQPPRFVDSVEPRIDTQLHSRWIHFASAARPFGMVGLSPDTVVSGDWGSGYIYRENYVRCFSHIHCMQISGIPVMPAIGRMNGHEGYEAFKLAFSHDDERVKPGYHKIVFKNGITAELTSTKRVGIHRYHFPATDEAYVYFDIGAPLAIEGKPMTDAMIRRVSDREVAGYSVMPPTFRRPKPFTVYFAAQFDSPMAEFGGWERTAPKAPKIVRFVDELPRGPSGKVQRLKLAVLAPAA